MRLLAQALMTTAVVYGMSMKAQTTSGNYTQRTNIPTLYIETTSGKDPVDKKTYLPCTMTYVDGGNVTTYTLTGAGIRGRGNTTWSANKKPWRVKFDKKTELLGSEFAKAKSWTLLANSFDKSLMRNALTYHLGKYVGLEFCPCYQFVDLVMNGTYRGTYQLSDQMEVNDKRVPVNSDTGWLLEYANAADKVDEPKVDFKMDGSSYGYMQIKNPEFEGDNLTTNPDLATAIQTYLNKTLGNQLKLTTIGYDYIDPFKGYRALVDTAALINWYIATEVTANWDGFYSIYTFREEEDGAPLHFGPLWDEDLAYGNHSETTDRTYFPQLDFYKKLLVECNFDKNKFPGGYRKMQPIIKHFWDDPWFANAVNMRFNDLMEKGLQTYLEGKVDELKTELTQSAAANFQRWSITDDAGYSTSENRKSWETAVSNLRSFIGTRLAMLKTQFAEKNANNRYLDETMDCLAALSSQTRAATSTQNVVVNRTVKAGMWNTICLPFALDASLISYFFGEGSVVEAFTSVTIQDGNVSLNFTKVDAMQAGMPYLVRPTRDVHRPFSFLNVSLSALTPTIVTHDGYSFCGIYAPTQLAEDGTQLFVGANNQLLTPVTNSSALKSFRAYFSLPATGSASAKINLCMDGTATAIGGVEMLQEPVTSRIYNLNGQYVGDCMERLGKGVYVINGKKVVKE